MATTFNGQTLTQPQARTAFNMNALTPNSPNQPAPHTLVLVGPANQGKNTLVRIAIPEDIHETLGTGGDLAQAATLTFSPSPVSQNGQPLKVYQVNPTTQGTISLVNSSGTTEISVTTTRWGEAANQIKVAVGSGTTQGYKVTIGDDASGSPPVVQDNLALPILQLTVSGTSPTATATDSKLTITTGSTSPVTLVSVSFSSTTTVQQVVNQLNQNSAVTATLMDPNPNDLAQALFDNVSSVALSSTAAVTLSGDIVAVVRALNNGLQPWLSDATRSANATTLATTGSWQYASGGSTGSASTTDWQNAYTALEQEQDALWVIPISATPSIWAMNQAHCQKMHGEGYGRSGFVGGSSGTTVAVAKTNAATLASEYTGYLTNGIQRTQSGVTTTIPPYQAAAVLGAMAAGLPLNEALTMKPITATGLEQQFASGDIDTLIRAGCIVLKPYHGQFVVAKGQTTAAVDPSATVDAIQSQVVTERFVLEYGMNAILSAFIGQPIVKTTAAQAQAKIYHYLKSQATGSNALLFSIPSLNSIQVTISGTIIMAQAPASPVVAADFALTTLYASVDTAAA